MLINRFNTGVHKSPVTAQLPPSITQLRNRIESALSPSVKKWVAEQAQRITRERQSMVCQEMRLRTAIRVKFFPITGTGPYPAAVEKQLMEDRLRYVTLTELFDTLAGELAYLRSRIHQLQGTPGSSSEISALRSEEGLVQLEMSQVYGMITILERQLFNVQAPSIDLMTGLAA